MTESDITPDPVEETAPKAPPAPDDPERGDEYVDEDHRGAVFPGTDKGGAAPVPLPPTPGRAV
jgi:hypothetical protein